MGESCARTNWSEKAFDFAQETTKQVIALAAAILTITATFHSDLEKATRKPPEWPLQLAWIFYAASILGGAWTLMALTGTLERATGAPSIYGKNIRIPAFCQLSAFVVGIGLTATFGWLVLGS